jgi:hypothetical protein
MARCGEQTATGRSLEGMSLVSVRVLMLYDVVGGVSLAFLSNP